MCLKHTNNFKKFVRLRNSQEVDATSCIVLPQAILGSYQTDVNLVESNKDKYPKYVQNLAKSGILVGKLRSILYIKYP